jgi:hypothetical protein
MINILPSLNNFSKSLEDISEGFDKNLSTSNDLPFTDISPLLIPPPPVEDESDIFPKKFNKSKNDIGKKIIDLQKSIVEKLDIGNDLVREQKQSLKLSQSQNTIILPDILTNFENIPTPQLNEYKKDFTEKEQKLSTNNLNQTNLPIQTIDLPELDKLKFKIDVDNLPKIEIDDIKVGFDLKETNLLKMFEDKIIKIPINYDFPRFNLPKSFEMDVFYNFMNTLPTIGNLQITSPKFDLPKYDAINIPINTEVDFVNMLNRKDFSNLIQKIDYIESRNILENTVKRIGYEYPNLIDPIEQLTTKINVDTEYINPYTKLPEIINSRIPLGYDISTKLDLPSLQRMTIPVILEQLGEKFDIPSNENYEKKLKVNFETQKLNFQNLDNLLSDSKNILIDTTSQKTQSSSVAIPKSILEFQNRLKMDFETTNTVNQINKKEEYVVKDGFNETINNVSNFLDTFINKLDNLNDFELNNPFEQITLKSIKNEENSKELVSNVDLSKLSSINRSSIPSVMMSTMDSKQFNSLMDTLEQNSKVISENFKQNSTEKVTTNSMINFSIPNQTENKSKSEDKLVEIMSSLDDKMTIMISALSNISTWVNENRTTSTSLRHYKH